MRFVNLKVIIDGKKKIDLTVSAKKTRLEQELITKNDKLLEDADARLKKVKD